jgi:hypothetical protein
VTALVAFDDDSGRILGVAGYPQDHEIGWRIRNL